MDPDAKQKPSGDAPRAPRPRRRAAERPEPAEVASTAACPVPPAGEAEPCPVCRTPMMWVSGGPRCPTCGFKESCCF